MKSRIWQLAGVGVLSMGISLGAMAEGPGEGHGERGPQGYNEAGPSRGLNSRDEVRQTQPPRQGYYQDIPRQHGDNRHWQGRPDRYWKVPYRGRDYFYSGGYWYIPQGGSYVLVEPPPGIPVPLQQPGPTSYGYDVVAYPMYGQGPQQQDQDRYQCHRWAVSQSGFDPATAAYAPPAVVADNYRRALGACLSGRGYSVN